MNFNQKRRLFLKGSARYLGSSLSVFKKIKFIFWSVIKSSWIISVEDFFEQQKLSYLLSKQPAALYMFRMHAFMSKRVTKDAEILELAKAHFSALSALFTQPQILQIYQDGWVVYEAEIQGYQVQLKLQYDHRMRFEGQLTLKLMVNGEELYYLHFLLSDTAVYIGGIQGAKGQLELNKVVTKITEGLRPQNFIYFGFTVLCQALGRQEIYGIRNAFHIYQNESKSKEKVLYDFEQLWLELGGVEFSDEWMTLPLTYARKPLEEVSNKKRSTYRKRYVLMDDIATKLLEKGSRCDI